MVTLFWPLETTNVVEARQLRQYEQHALRQLHMVCLAGLANGDAPRTPRDIEILPAGIQQLTLAATAATEARCTGVDDSDCPGSHRPDAGFRPPSDSGRACYFPRTAAHRPRGFSRPLVSPISWRG